MSLLGHHGLGFLFFIIYAALPAGALFVAYQLREWLRWPDDDGEPRARGLDTYAISLLAGKERRAAEAVLASLHARGLISLDGETRRVLQRPLPEGLQQLHPFERAVLAAVPGDGTPLDSLYAWAGARAYQDFTAELRERGLICTLHQKLLTQVLPACLLGDVFLIGLAMSWRAAGQGHSIQWHVPLLLMTLVCGAAFVALPGWRTRRGDGVHEALRHKNGALLATAGTSGGSQLQGPELLLAVGLFGLAAVNVPSLKELQSGLAALSQGQGSCGGGCGDGGGGGCGGCGGCGG